MALRVQELDATIANDANVAACCSPHHRACHSTPVGRFRSCRCVEKADDPRNPMPPVEEHAPDDGEGVWYSRPQADRIAGRYFDAVTNNSIFMLAYQRFMDKSLLVWSRRINSQAAHCGVIIAAVSRFICKSLRVGAERGAVSSYPHLSARAPRDQATHHNV